ncbi:MAG: hypothetical protein J3R72DRAFT_395604 [Linnemannia gamsii]|nr:MAG: hypothetical protein J3R72DRAFT_395604 [Linnemannia gamsii]
MSTTSALTPEQLSDLQESFSAFDRNGDGTINKSELRGLLHTVGHKVDSEGLASLLKEFDNDQSEAIDFQEFVALADRITKNKSTNTLTHDEVASLKESFRTFDKNGDGSINATELRSLLRIVGESLKAKHLSDAMQEFDTNKDNLIDFDEFVVLVNKISKNKIPVTL